MTKDANNITSDEWLAELGKLSAVAPGSGDPGLTVMEICEKTGLEPRKARERIKEGIRAGTIRVGKAYRLRIDGVLHRYPVYLTVKRGEGRGLRIGGHGRNEKKKHR